MRKAIPILSAILILSQGCYYDNVEELYEFEDQLNATNCDDVDVSYTAEIFPIIQGNCSTPGCHVAGGNGILFENYNNVKANVDNGSMLAVLPNWPVIISRLPSVMAFTPCGIV